MNRLVLLVSALLCCPAAWSESEETIRISKPDLAYISALSADRVLDEAYKRLGMKVIYRLYPSARSLLSANQGQTDGEHRRIEGIASKYPNLIRVAVPIAFTQAMAFTRDPELVVIGWESLKPHKVGIVRGSRNSELKTQGMRVEASSSGEQLFKKLAAGRIDIAVYPLEGQCLAQSIGLSGVASHPLERTTLYHYLHKRRSDLVPRLERVLREMEQEHLIGSIYESAVEDYLAECSAQ